MAKDLDKNVLEELNKKVDVLLKKFSEQKGIIDAYIKKEREWKKHKLDQANIIKKLEKSNVKLNKKIKSYDQ